MNFKERLDEDIKTYDNTDICVYCGEPDCDKIALPDLSYIDHPERKFVPGDMCHSECEREGWGNANSEIESAKAEFGRRMKSPKRLTEPKEGSPYGDIPYASWEKFKAGG